MRLPVFSKPDFQELQEWEVPGISGSFQPALPDNMGPTRRTRRTRGLSTTSNQRRRRGVRKWVVVSVGAQSSDHCTIPQMLLQLLEWLVRIQTALWKTKRLAIAIQHTGSTSLSTTEHVEPWRAWGTTPVELLLKNVISEQSECNELLRSVIVLTMQVVQTVPAHSSRDRVYPMMCTPVPNETLQCLFNNIVWHLNGAAVALAYVHHMLVPQMLGHQVGGIPNVTGMALHFDNANAEWYVSTEGSNFLAL